MEAGLDFPAEEKTSSIVVSLGGGGGGGGRGGGKSGACSHSNTPIGSRLKHWYLAKMCKTANELAHLGGGGD